MDDEHIKKAIEYSSQLTDDGKQIYVELDGHQPIVDYISTLSRQKPLDIQAALSQGSEITQAQPHSQTTALNPLAHSKVI